MLSKTSWHKSFVAALAISWVFVFTIILSVSIPYNPIGKPFIKNRHFIRGLLPQGFAFFTRDAREDKLFFLVKEGGKYIEDPRLRNATFQNMFGLRRQGRVLNLIYSSKMLRADYKWYGVSNTTHLDFEDPSLAVNHLSVKNTAELLSYEDMIVIKKKIIPWAYRNFQGQGEDNTIFTKLHVKFK